MKNKYTKFCFCLVHQQGDFQRDVSHSVSLLDWTSGGQKEQVGDLKEPLTAGEQYLNHLFESEQSVEPCTFQSTRIISRH